MIIEDEYTDFEDMTVESSREVWWAKTDEIVLEWKGQKFMVRIAENSKGGEFIWMEGQEQFSPEVQEEIEEYIWSGELDISAE
jgi:hypothetical protein